MQKPIQITERGLTLPEEAREKIRQRAEALEKFDDRLTSCHVVCEAPHRHQNSGSKIKISVALSTPGKTLAVNRQESEDLNAAIRDAFDAARRELEDAVRERDGRVKARSGAGVSAGGGEAEE